MCTLIFMGKKSTESIYGKYCNDLNILWENTRNILQNKSQSIVKSLKNDGFVDESLQIFIFVGFLKSKRKKNHLKKHKSLKSQ